MSKNVRPLFTYRVTHIGPPNKTTVRTEKITAVTPQAAMARFKGRQMTPDEIQRMKKK